MPTFTVNLDCSSAAFEDNTEGEVARILREIADRVENRDAKFPGFYQTIHDINGNDVGRWRLTN